MLLGQSLEVFRALYLSLDVVDVGDGLVLRSSDLLVSITIEGVSRPGVLLEDVKDAHLVVFSHFHGVVFKI